MNDWTFSHWLDATHAGQSETYGLDVSVPGFDRAEYIRTNVLAATDELHEFLGETGWKPWKKVGHGEVNRDLAADELVDVLMFVGNLLAMLGVSGYELSQRYEHKMEINAQRQREGY